MSEKGLKFDNGKPRMDLLAPRFLMGTADVLGFGAAKYGPYNWAAGINYSRIYAGIQRHLNAYWSGEDIDPESGKSHLYHAACGLMMLSEMSHLHPELDDRFKEGQR